MMPTIPGLTSTTSSTGEPQALSVDGLLSREFFFSFSFGPQGGRVGSLRERSLGVLVPRLLFLVGHPPG